jgi:hypothetical protein
MTKLSNRDNQPENQEVEIEEEVDEDKKGLCILHSEVVKAIKKMNGKKAAGDDNVPGEVLKLLGEDGLKIMT